jgi:GT2 family glycosyltransferase
VTTAQDWELVIVDNGSTDGTREYLASINQKQFNRVHVTATFHRRPGLGGARNKGWKTAKANIISFTDDDCYVSEKYVDSILQVFQGHPEIGFLCGRVLLFDPMDYRITIQESQQQFSYRPKTFVAAGAVTGANMAFKRTVLEQIDGFDERLGAGTPFNAGEDTDAVAAAVWSGILGVYDPRPIVYHHHGRRTETEVLELQRKYDAGRGAYYTKYILRRDSRSEYLRAWIGNMRFELIEALRRGRFPQHSLRELYSGLQFAIRNEFKKKNVR